MALEQKRDALGVVGPLALATVRHIRGIDRRIEFLVRLTSAGGIVPGS